MIVAIDGPAGSGKSTVAKLVAQRLGMHYLDTGAMYRSVAWAALQAGVAPDDERRVVDIARSISIDLEHSGSSTVPSRVMVDGRDATRGIRTPEVDDAVSAVARMPGVREALVPLQRSEGRSCGLVAEGRDIGTVVFPDAEVKIFLTASPEERARRRHRELEERGEHVDESFVLDRMAARDEVDSTRASAPLVAAADAEVLDTSGMSIEEVVDAIADRVESRR